MNRHPAELAVDELVAQVEVAIPLEVARELVELGGYAPARGMFRGRHWRRERGTGCYHLRVHDGSAWLHWDAFDPRRYPIRHALETPEIAVGAPLAAGALGTTAALASKAWPYVIRAIRQRVV